MESKTTGWRTPRLLVLARADTTESVLGICKATAMSVGANNVNATCEKNACGTRCNQYVTS